MHDPVKRNLLLTIWLYLLLMVNAIMAVTYLVLGQTIKTTLPLMPMTIITGFVIISLLNVVAVIALLKWKKWGFWLICLTATATCAIYIQYTPASLIMSIVGSYIGVLLLYAALHLGKENKAWPRLTW